MAKTIFWYDYETTGTNPRTDRPIQVAGLRTDEYLNEVDEPLSLYCRLTDDILPHPAACLITGISPQVLQGSGVTEARFMAALHAQLSKPGTCVAGYNNLRFDDEVTRYSLYRNFYDPYAREWQHGNSRWDLIDLVRACYALRPEDIVWPEENGQVTLKLECLTQANDIDHGQAHDALSDVRATVALARLIRERQPRLYAYLYQLRSKQRVMERLQLMQPVLHVSGRFAGKRRYLAPVLPLAWHPDNRNALIVCDLSADPAPLIDEPAVTLRERLYTRRDELQGALPVPLKLIHINRCPVVAPLAVLRDQDKERLCWDESLYRRHIHTLKETESIWKDKLSVVFATDRMAGAGDPEQQLYAGFLDDHDRRLCEKVRMADPYELGEIHWPFKDLRLPELLFRYRARNYPDTLTPEERSHWIDFCRKRLTCEDAGAPNTFDYFSAEIECVSVMNADQQNLLVLWQAYAESLKERLAL